MRAKDEPFQPDAGWRGFSNKHRAEQARGLRRCSGRAVRAAGEGTWAIFPAIFSVEKTLVGSLSHTEEGLEKFSPETSPEIYIAILDIAYDRAEGNYALSQFGQSPAVSVPIIGSTTPMHTFGETEAGREESIIPGRPAP